MFIPFFYKLKEKKVPVSMTEWMVLMEALSKNCATNLNEFYFLARSILVKSETHFDQYDVAFQEYFNGIAPPIEVTEELLSWLADPKNRPQLTPEEMADCLLGMIAVGCRDQNPNRTEDKWGMLAQH